MSGCIILDSGIVARKNGKRLPCEVLQAENAKLREEFNKMDVWHSKELTAAMDENAKLRELVRELWAQAEQNLVCDDNCPYGAACDWKDCVFERLMRELGVEVDDG